MKVLTIIDGNDAFQVKAKVDSDKPFDKYPSVAVRIDVLTVDQSKILWTEYFTSPKPIAATHFVNNFSKSDAKKVVKRYLMFK